MILSKQITVTSTSTSLLTLMGIDAGLRGNVYAVLQVPTGGNIVRIGAKSGEVIEILGGTSFESGIDINIKDLYLVTATTQVLNVGLFYE